MRFPIVIHKDQDSDYGVTIPSLPGCFSAGDTTDDALSNAVEAIECHIEGLLLDGESLPTPEPIEHYRDESRFSGGVWALVDVDISKLSGKAKRVNITLPERLLTQIDSFAASHGDTRSGFLMHAALEYGMKHGVEFNESLKTNSLRTSKTRSKGRLNKSKSRPSKISQTALAAK